MSDYIVNKLLSFGVVLGCILLTYGTYGFTPKQWQIILLCILLFGYAHFLVGFFYQIKGFARAEMPWTRYVSFVVLTIGSIALAYVLFTLLGFVLSLFIGFLYFLFHGLLNEQTLIARQTGLQIPLLPLGALAIFIISLLLYSVPDKTFFFDNQLVFYPVSEEVVDRYFLNERLPVEGFTTIFWIGVASAFALLALSWYRYQYPRLMLTLFLLMGLSTGGVLLFSSPPYIYMYLVVVGYHFVTWLLFYLTEFSRRGRSAWYAFILINIGVFGLLLGMMVIHRADPTPVTEFIFDYRTFVILTYIHISTSFMNDRWWKRIESKMGTAMHKYFTR